MYHFCFVYIYPLNGYRELNSVEEPCLTRVATVTYFARASSSAHMQRLLVSRLSYHYTKLLVLFLRYLHLDIYP